LADALRWSSHWPEDAPLGGRFALQQSGQFLIRRDHGILLLLLLAKFETSQILGGKSSDGCSYHHQPLDEVCYYV
jgi:hypothetical protein